MSGNAPVVAVSGEPVTAAMAAVMTRMVAESFNLTGLETSEMYTDLSGVLVLTCGAELGSLPLMVRDELEFRSSSSNLEDRLSGNAVGPADLVHQVFPRKQANIEQWVDALSETVMQAFVLSPLMEIRIRMGLLNVLKQWRLCFGNQPRLSVYLPSEVLFLVNARSAEK